MHAQKRLLVLMHKTSLVNERQKYASWFNLNFNRLSNYHHSWTPCKVEKGGFVGLGIVKLKYRLWYYFFVLLHKLGINKGNKDRYKFY